jgi:hypothetical protein
MSEPFDQPSKPGAGVDLQPLLGSLLLITVHGTEREIATVHGVADAIRADVDVLDGMLRGEHHADVFLFPRVLQGQLRGHIGGKVIGRLTQGVAKPGKNAPWQLADATDGDIAIGKAFLAGGLSSVATAASSAPPF